MKETIYCQKCDLVFERKRLKYGNCPSCGNALNKKKKVIKNSKSKLDLLAYKSYKDYINNAPRDINIRLSFKYWVKYDDILESWVLWEVSKNYSIDLFHGTRDKCVSYYFKNIQKPKARKKYLSGKKN